MNKLSRRIIGAIPVLLGISFLIFLLMHIAPGDPVSLLARRRCHAGGYRADAPRMGLGSTADRAVLGLSHSGGDRRLRQVAQVQRAGNKIGQRAACRRRLNWHLPALCVAILIAVPLGVYSAIQHNSLLDHAGMSVALIGVSLPNFWLGIMLIYFLGGQLNLAAGRRPHRIRH